MLRLRPYLSVFRAWLGLPDREETVPPRRGAMCLLELYPETYQVWVQGERVHLSPQEFRVLHYLWERRDRVVIHPDLERAVYGEEGSDSRRAMRQLVHRLRDRLQQASTLLETVNGVGYVLWSRTPSEQAAARDA